ncbi:MAG TPA: MarC family protein [Thermomicrobiales bacterium]|nr:MarC family protein [Thermomicrobiales bacterium]
MSLASAAVLLFFVMDPLGNVPLFLAALRYVDPARARRIIIRELLIALAIMIAFLFAGSFLLDLLAVTPAALTAAGGVILLLIAIRMIFPTSERTLRERVTEEPFVVPLAIPYTAGPSALATELLLMSRDSDRWATWLAAILLAWLASAVILYSSSYLQKVLGERGLTAIERLMGMVLVIVAMQMLLDGIAQFFE